MRVFASASSEFVESTPIASFSGDGRTIFCRSTGNAASQYMTGLFDSGSSPEVSLTTSSAGANFTIKYTPGFGVNVSSSSAYSPSVIHTIAGTSRTDRDHALSVDGDLTTSTSISNTMHTATLDLVCIGARANFGTHFSYLNGDVGEIAIWDRSMTDAEIQLMTGGIYSPLFFYRSDLIFYAKLIGDAKDLIGGVVMTEGGTPTVSDHPRIIYPRKRSIIRTPSVVIPSTRRVMVCA